MLAYAHLGRSPLSNWHFQALTLEADRVFKRTVKEDHDFNEFQQQREKVRRTHTCWVCVLGFGTCHVLTHGTAQPNSIQNISRCTYRLRMMPALAVGKGSPKKSVGRWVSAWEDGYTFSEIAANARQADHGHQQRDMNGIHKCYEKWGGYI